MPEPTTSAPASLPAPARRGSPASQVAERLNVSASTWRSYVAPGQAPAADGRLGVPGLPDWLQLLPTRRGEPFKIAPGEIQRGRARVKRLQDPVEPLGVLRAHLAPLLAGYRPVAYRRHIENHIRAGNTTLP